MSRVLKLTSYCCCVVGILSLSANAQRRVFFAEQGQSPSTQPSGNSVIFASPGTTVCVDVYAQGDAANPDTNGINLQWEDGTNAVGDSGTVIANCSTLFVDTARGDYIGFASATIGPAACQNPTPPIGAPFTLAVVELNLDQSPQPLPASPDGTYVVEVCYDVSADACGDFIMDFVAIGVDSFITNGSGVLDGAAVFSSLDIRVRPTNDACVDGTAIGNTTANYDNNCATQDGPLAHAACGLNTGGDVWYEYTADCTGDLTITNAGTGVVAAYNPNVGCTPTDADVADCGTGALSLVVTAGDTVLIQVGQDGTTPVTGSITTACAPFCTGGQAAGSALTNAECSPNTPPDDPSQCELWFCDPAAGGCTVVNGPDGIACDDGLFCAVNDVCTAGVCAGPDARNCDDGAPCTDDTCNESAGTCDNVDINLFSCTTVADCPAGASDCIGGQCECVANPPLCLNATDVTAPGAAAGACGFVEGGQIQVSVDLGFSTTKVCGAQLFMEYDTSCMEFVSIEPAGGVFNTVLFEFVDTTNGTIDYVVGAAPGQICDGTNGPTSTAIITFNSTCSCKTQGVKFRAHNPPTRLGGADGSEVCPLGHVNEAGLCNEINSGVFSPCNTGKLTIDSSAPSINCPVFKTGGNADCGVVTRNVTWDPLVAVDNCDGAVPVTCSITHNRGADVSALLSSGGDFPPGLTTVDCGSVQDTCGNKSGCTFSVFNSGQNLIEVDVELSPTMDAGPITRGIELTVSDCGSIANATAITACDSAEFGFPFNIPGHGVVNAKVPPGNYACVEARDPLHTLSSSCALTCGVLADGGTGWVASFKGTKDLSATCHWLVNGNLNGDPNIDILDYVTYLNQVANNAAPGANTPCGMAGPHADINGDGIVNLQDFSFILINIFNNDKAGCDAVCAPSAVAPGNGPIDSISLRELSAMGLGRAGRLADIDRNGTVDVADMALYLENGGTANTEKPVRDARRTTRGTRSVRGLR